MPKEIQFKDCLEGSFTPVAPPLGLRNIRLLALIVSVIDFEFDDLELEGIVICPSDLRNSELIFSEFLRWYY